MTGLGHDGVFSDNSILASPFCFTELTSTTNPSYCAFGSPELIRYTVTSCSRATGINSTS